MLTSESKITSPDNILYTQVEDELIILDLLTGKYFSLNQTGAAIFKMFIKYDMTFGEVMKELKSMYPESNDTEMLKDVRDIAKDLKDSGIFHY